MVFHAITVWLLVASVPLWAYRWIVLSKLDARERSIFKRLVTRRYESAFRFGARVFGYLIALAVAVLLLVYGLGYLKKGHISVGSYKDTIGSRFYSGMEPIDQALNTFHYEQPLPLAILTTCFLLSVAFTLVVTALRDITLVNRLRRKLGKFQSDGNSAKPTQGAAP